MLRKWNRILSFILAIALVATTFNSDLATVRVFADDDVVQDVGDAQPQETVVEEPVVEEPAAEPEYVEAETEDPAPADDPIQNDETIQDAEPTEGENIEGEPTDGESIEGEPIEGEPTDEELEEKELTEEELAELAEKEAKEKAEKEAAEKEAKKKLVTVSYTASLGGKVSNSSETIDINDEEAKFEGSTASAVNKYYQFVAWVDADGNTVCGESTFVPSNIEEDATFTANFMKMSEMPAQSFSGSAGGMNVSVSADEGIFPEGTTMNVSAISDDEALDAAKDAIGEAAQTAKGVDITFRNADGEEIEPADARYVHVSISLASELEGESFSVVHKDDSGNADVIASASASGAEFEANQFSIYIVVGTDTEIIDPATEIVTNTYVFMNGDTEFSRQTVKEGEELINPGVPTLGDNQEFKGWFYKDDNEAVEFVPKTGITEEKTIECYAKIETTFYLTFIGVDKEVTQVKQKVVEGDEPANIETGDVHVTPKDADDAYRGWTIEEGDTTLYPVVNAREHSKVYPVIMKAHWITFVENDGDDHGGASFTGPVSVFEDQKPIDVKPADPTRRGYVFGGWYENKGEGDGQVVGDEFAWNSTLTKDVTLYAKWTPAEDTQYTVIIWQQKISDSKNTTDNSQKTYDYKTSFTETGRTGAHIDSSIGNNYKNQGSEGFHYSWCEVIRKKGDQDIPVTEIRAKGDTIVNVYFDRDLMTINFHTWEKHGSGWGSYHQWDITSTYTGLYGQTLAQNGYTWPTTHAWYDNGGSSGDASGTRLTFLDAFLFKGLSGVSEDGKTLNQYGEDLEGSATIRFYTQNTDETWPSDPAYTTQAGGGTFHITDKYNGFKAHSYRTYRNKQWGSWTSAVGSDGKYVSVSSGYTVLEIRFERLKYDITFIENYRENLTTLKTVTGVPYDALISPYSGQAPDIPEFDESKPGYKFNGWFLDAAGTKPFVWTGKMPAANMVVYGCYVPVRYTVTLDAVGGTLPTGQDQSFELDYGDTVNKTSLMNTTKDGYELMGWYENGAPYGYGGVTHDTKLVAKWRNPGTVKVVYDANGGSNAPEDKYNYSSSSNVVVGAPPTPASGYTFVGWTIDGDSAQIIYYPNGCFEITPDYVKNGKVTLIAQYIKTGGDAGVTTTITYKPNGGQGSDVTTAPILVNEKVIALTAEQCGFTREGYEFKGWSRTGGEDATVEINAGENIAADNNKFPNELYAVWECVTGTYIIEYYKGEVTTRTDLAHYLGESDPATARVGAQITLNGTQLNAYRPNVGYQDGVQIDAPYTVHKGNDNIIYVLYSPKQITVTVEGTQKTQVYNGQKVTVTKFVVTDITGDSNYKAEYVDYDGETDISATHVYESKEISLDASKFKNISSLFDSKAITFVLGEVKSNKVEITPATLTVTTPPASKVYDGTPLTKEGTISGFVNGETATFTTTGTITTPGKVINTYTLDWEGATADERDYTVSENLGILEITESTAAITVTTVGGEFVYDGSERGATVTVSKLPEGYTLEKAESSAKATDVTETAVPATADTLIIRNVAGDDVTEDLNITKIDGSITITPAPITIVTDPGSKVYDGTPLTADGKMTGLVNDETATFTVTGSQTEVGTSDNTYTLEWDGTAKESNYYIESESVGKLTVTEYAGEIVVTTTGGKFTYDGKPHGATVKVSDLPTGYRLDTAASSATATDVTTAPVEATADTLIIRNAAGEDVTSKLKDNIRYVDDTIEVTPATLTIVTPDAEKVYDGKPLTAEGSISGFVNNETATFTTTGTITNVGEEPNSYELEWNGTAKKSNYELDETIGTLKVTEFAGEIKVITTGGEFEYDGEAHGATVEVQGLPEDGGYTVQTATSSATATDVTEEDVDATCDELVIVNADGVDVTSKLKITKEDGYIKITPAKVTVNIKGDQKCFKYNGQEQKAEGYKVTEISNPLYKESEMSFAGEAIAKGKTPDTYPMNLKAEQFTNNNKNFEVTFAIEDGSLTIEPLGPGEEFRIYATAIDAERDYTGNYYDGFRYELRGEGPTQNIIIEAAGRAVEFFREMFAPIKADADDGERSDPTVTINGVEFTVKGLSVPTRERNAGDYELPIVGDMQVFDGDVDVTDQFVLVERNSGKLTIYPMVINLTSGSAAKVYDGTPLTNSNITADKDWGVGDKVRYNITGTQTAVGSSSNTFVAVPEGDTNLDLNYRINYTYGTLTVTNAPTPPPGGGTTITDDPTPTAPTPLAAPPAAVLGATRETDGAAVLGARRGRTDDEANVPGRIFAVLVAAAVATALLLTRKKEEDK
ncbi:InlB B-repeat-containing protein [Butyrivibrio sp. FCS006]|uniref:InlB B-repeat-containing protein n=1 Tax=Butyrivibrio sp. FCS006 TaxID=1280684 RepID=UPI000421AA84|nr:InlB B-repeat-containing protein [Butyrivibrio sp. FCS006]